MIKKTKFILPSGISSMEGWIKMLRKLSLKWPENRRSQTARLVAGWERSESPKIDREIGAKIDKKIDRKINHETAIIFAMQDMIVSVPELAGEFGFSILNLFPGIRDEGRWPVVIIDESEREAVRIALEKTRNVKRKT